MQSTPPLNAAERVIKDMEVLFDRIASFVGGSSARLHPMDLPGKFSVDTNEDRQLLRHLRYLWDIAAVRHVQLFFQPCGAGRSKSTASTVTSSYGAGKR